MYISKITIRNFRIFNEIGITAFFKKGVNAIISENNCGKTAIIDAMRIAFSTAPYKKDIYFNLSDFHVRNDGVRCDEAFISVYFDEISPDFFEIWDPENPSKGEFHIRYYTIKTPEGKEKIRYNIWGGPVEGNPVSADIFEAIQLVFLGALRDAETEMRPSRSSKLASLFSTATNTDEAKEEIINVLRMANSEILKKDSLIRVGHIVNDNLSTIEQDVLKQSIELGLVEPRFEAIAGALRAWIKPRWVYLRKDHSEFQLLKDSYSEEEWTKNTSEDETGVYLDILALRQLKKDLPAAVVMLLDTLSLNSFELFQNGLGYNNILFMSTVLGDMKTSADTALFNLLLVEEPEAHLHPQLQELVHGFFDKNSNREIFIAVAACQLQRLVFKGNISIGYLVTATNLINFTNQPVQVISQSVSKIIATTDIRHRFVLVRQNTHQDISSFTGFQVGNMSLQHVYFRYNNNDAYALNDINCTFLQNKKYAIMGPSGSGKSTLAKVISGMYRNYEGNILYDGKELRNMSHAESTHVIETIPQNPFIFNGTVYEITSSEFRESIAARYSCILPVGAYE